MEILELEILRRHKKETYTIGTFSDVKGLYYPNHRICDTLEDKVRDLHDYNHDGDFDDEGEGKIYGKTAIPPGRYEIKMVLWKKFNDYFPMLMNVPGYSGIFIHGGRDEDDSLGCPLVGENKVKGGLINGPYWSTTIRQMIKKHLAIKDSKCFLTIKQ